MFITVNLLIILSNQYQKLLISSNYMKKIISFNSKGFIHKMASASKKAKTDKIVKNNPFEHHSDVNNSGNLLNAIQKSRTDTANSVLEFNFAKKRVEIISHAKELPEKCQGVMYWMSRDARVQDNWAFLFAQKLALKNQVPLHVNFCLAPHFVPETYRHYHFLLKGLEEVASECKELNISFNLLKGNSTVLTEWVEKNNIGAVVCDFSPLRTPRAWRDEIKTKLPADVPLIQVDAHNIVPCLIASDKLEYSARTIRNKINSKLDEFLTEFPPVIKHKYSSKLTLEVINWEKELESLEVDRKVTVCEWAKPGTDAGLKMLEQFIDTRLKLFGSKRNNPVDDVISKLSPWFRFGQISVQRAVLCVQKLKTKHIESVNAFCEEAIIRRELSDNFCYYNEHYDSIKGASNWAQKTLDDHRKDKRAYIYTLEQLTEAKTHDDLWNSAQIQLVKEGKMHGFLRMYWAKKILEWSPSPEDALQYALHLNDYYSLDGTDPNGFVGCMWSVCGIHDQGWTERPIFGKIRFMNYDGCKRKFSVQAFVARYGGKVHKYVAPKS